MTARMEFNFSFARPQTQSTSSDDDDGPLRILILGNFSGGGPTNDGKPRLPLKQRPFIRIDIDSFDDVLRRLAPRVVIHGESNTDSSDQYEIQQLDDFRPEQLIQKLRSVRMLFELRQKLLNPATFSDAAAELRRFLPASAAAPDSTTVNPATAANTSPEEDAALLERLLGQAPAGVPKTGQQKVLDSPMFDLQSLIERTIAPYIAPQSDPRQDVYLAAVDGAISEVLRRTLHSPSLQSLEASWRSLHKLISNIEDDSEIRIHLLDVSYQELLADFPADDEQLERWDLYRLLTDNSGQSTGDSGWSLMVADFRIAAQPNELGLLGALAATAMRLQCPLISSANSNLLGCSSLVDCPNPSDWQPLDVETSRYWQTLRQSPSAAWVGLALPRVLLRLPYGKQTDEVETFAFEEFETTSQHEQFLWGNPAYVCAELITQAFVADGWSMQLDSQVDIRGLPAYTFTEDGESKLKPCAEANFGERTAAAILQSGIMPLLSWKDRDAVRFLRFQSIADPLSPLAGL